MCGGGEAKKGEQLKNVCIYGLELYTDGLLINSSIVCVHLNV